MPHRHYRHGNQIAPRDPLACPDQVDLPAYYGTSLNDEWFNHAGRDLQDVPQGLQSFGGVLFVVRGLIVLAGSRSLEVHCLVLPEAVFPLPNLEIIAFDFVSALTNAAPMLAAMTVEPR